MEDKMFLALAVIAGAAFWKYRGLSQTLYGTTTDNKIIGLQTQLVPYRL